jgi:hypothetical protein
MSGSDLITQPPSFGNAVKAIINVNVQTNDFVRVHQPQILGEGSNILAGPIGSQQPFRQQHMSL